MDYPDYSNFPSDYTSPFEPGTSPIGSDYDWGSFSKGIDWNQTPSVAGESRWSEAFKKATDYLNSTKSRTLEEQKKRASSGIPGAQDLGGGISLAYPQVVQSGPQQSGFGRALGGVGSVLAAVAPFTGPAAPFLGAAAGLAGAGSRIA